MKYIRADVVDRFYCIGEHCPAQCLAPVDMTWSRTCGDLHEMGLSLGCPMAAELILLQKQPDRYLESSDSQPSQPLEPELQERLRLMRDARRTMELLLQNREMPFRDRLVLALTYSAGLEPILSDKRHFEYDELDWAFTEQPMRQLSGLAQLTGRWELKRSDMCNILWVFHQLSRKDAVLEHHLGETLRLFQNLSGEEYRHLRDEFEAKTEARQPLLEHLAMYYVHRYFLAGFREATVAPSAKLMAVSVALIGAMGGKILHETGSLNDETFVTLCWHFGRCMEEDSEVWARVKQTLQEPGLFDWERLQRLLYK